MSFTASFQLQTRNADGEETPLTGETLTIKEGSTTLDTVVSDSEGFVESVELVGTANDTVVTFHHGTYTATLNQTTKATELDAVIFNKTANWLIDDDFTDTLEAEFVNVFLKDNADDTIEPVFIGTGKPGDTIIKPYESRLNKTLKVYAVPKAENLAQSVFSFADAESGSLAASRPATELAETLVTDPPFEIDLTDTGFQTAYTVPTGFDFYTTKFVFHSPSDDFNAETEVIETLNGVITQDVGDFSAATDFIVRVVNVIASRIGAGGTLDFQLTDAISKPGTVKVDVFGYLREAAAETDYLTFGGDRLVFGGDPLSFNP